ncbi:unnamed protein product [Peronospora farinosa]|uniref:Uncharacterized protein n=1 Tax=Peronospora farinosa TaxID=134698 RepID=A0AAV0U9A7_9STRA|nr:unnamed protein product [Peronospora farinosa]CAI5732303.1 unnamed protein product [Peronospora farinosa]
MAVSTLAKCAELVRSYDRYCEKRPEGAMAYAEFVSSDLPSLQLMANSPKDVCALHAVQMALELMGRLDQEGAVLKKLSEQFMHRMVCNDLSLQGGWKHA